MIELIGYVVTFYLLFGLLYLLYFALRYGVTELKQVILIVLAWWLLIYAEMKRY